MKIQNTVCAIVVLYQPTAITLENIDALLEQFKVIILVDNGSSPLIENHLNSKDSERFIHLKNHSNLGVATALNQGFETALELGYEWAVSFDQDSKPAENFVSNILDSLKQAKEKKNNTAIIGPNIIDIAIPDAQYRCLTKHPFIPGFFKRQPCDSNDLENVSMVITSGALTNLRVHKEIGAFQDELFIDYVDTEYCLRLHKFGYKVRVSQKALLYHQLGDRKTFSVFGHKFRPTFHNRLRLYYIYRNRIPLAKEYALRFPHWFAFDLIAGIYNLIRVVFFEDNKLSKLKACISGTWDGLRGITGPKSI